RGLRTVGLLQRRQDGLVAGDGVLVAFGLAGSMRVLDADPGTGAASPAAAPRLAWRRRRRLRHPRRTPAALARTTGTARRTAFPGAGTGTLAAFAALSVVCHGGDPTPPLRGRRVATPPCTPGVHAAAGTGGGEVKKFFAKR